MLFNSFAYAVFFAVTLIVSVAIRSDRGKVWLFLLSSLFFYATWRAPYLALLLGTVGLNYAAALAIDRFSQHKKTLLIIAVSCNLLALGLFKYADFLIENVVLALRPFGVYTLPTSLELILPLGISFYTFQAISYIVDVYRGTIKPVRSWVDFATYLTFFPQLIAGPIVRGSEFLPQLKGLYERNRDTFRGVTRILIGLTKKVIIADWLGLVADQVFGAPMQYSPFVNLLVIYAYAFQIYCDFSGYCDIAIGCASLLGIRLPENFRQPYLADTPVEFWARWHITLTVWFRDYVYVPFALKRTPEGQLKARPYLALLVTWGLTGLWHGAAWTFVAWGFWHGLWLTAHRLWRGKFPAPDQQGTIRRAVAIVLTFNMVCLGYVLFRSATIEQAYRMVEMVVRGLVTDYRVALLFLVGGPLLLGVYSIASRLAALLREAFTHPRLSTAFAYGIMVGLFLIALALFAGPPARFIYFQF